MQALRDIKVVIRSPDGLYLSGGPVDWEFTDNLADAAVLNYLADDVETQLDRLKSAEGYILEALHVASNDLAESCDRCEDSMPPVEAFFDGKEFLCSVCVLQSQTAFSE